MIQFLFRINLALHDLKKDIPNLETDAFEEYLNNVAYHRIMKDLIQNNIALTFLYSHY